MIAGCREKQSYCLLSFLAGSFWEYFLFYGLAGFFYSFGLKASVLFVQDSFRFFTRSLAWDSPMRSWRPLSTKLIFFIPVSTDEKEWYFRFRIMASFFFPHPVRRFVQTTISFTRVRLHGTDILTNILYFLRQAGQSWPTFLIPLLTVSLWRPVNSKTEG